MGEETVRPAGSGAGAGAGPPVVRRFTSVWRLHDGRWLQVARQSTNVAGEPRS